jgi:hypothetical protein
MDLAVWYLVVDLASSALAPFQVQPALIGPVTETQCHEARDVMAPLPSVLDARCRRIIGAMTCGHLENSSVGTICPIFEGDITAPVGGGR